MYPTADVKNTNSSVIFRVSCVTCLKWWDCNGIAPCLWNTFFVCIFKNCGNLGLNSAGVYLYNSELTLSSPLFINFKAFSDSSDVSKVFMALNSSLILVHLRLLFSILCTVLKNDFHVGI